MTTTAAATATVDDNDAPHDPDAHNLQQLDTGRQQSHKLQSVAMSYTVRFGRQRQWNTDKREYLQKYWVIVHTHKNQFF